MTSNNKDRLSMLNGCECNSLTYEGCVYIKGNQVIMNGDVVDRLDSDSKVRVLWAEYVAEEGF